MAGEFKPVAMQGVRTEDETDAWVGFYDEEEQKQLSAQAAKEKAETKTENEFKIGNSFNTEKGGDGAWSGFYSEEEAKQQSGAAERETSAEKEYGGDEEDRKPPAKQSMEDLAARPTGDSDAGNTNKADSPSSKKPKKKSKPKSKSKPRSQPRPVDQSTREQTVSRYQSRASEKENTEHRGRKLHRRRQMRNAQSLGQAVEESSQQRLEQKFEELEDLMSRPLADTRPRVPKQYVERVVNRQHEHAEAGYGTASNGPDTDGYSTIRVLQMIAPSVHVTYENQHGSTPKSISVPDSSSPRQRRGSVDTPPTSSSGRSQSSYKDEEYSRRYQYSSDEDNDGTSDDDRPRKAYQPTDMHLKHTDNPKLREWLRRKDAEHRRARKAERAKRREERNSKMVEAELKMARREKSSERVKQWIEMKRKEALLQQKEERRRKKLEAKQQPVRRASSSPETGVTGTRIDRPRTAPVSKTPYRLIKRPNSAARLDEGDSSPSRPPDSKFLYKRSVTGRVRLMKLQNERNAELRSADQQRFKELSTKEGEKKTKTSYDEWLITKKKQEVEKRKAAKQQKEMMQSDPELERIIPQMARQRIERAKNGRRTLDTGLGPRRSSNNEDGQGEQGEEGQESGGSRPSYKLAINGVAASVSESPTPPRPTSAKARPPSARKATSPQRPQSASTARSSAGKAKTNNSTGQVVKPSVYKLPFPDDLGVPDHVRRVQERIFSKELTSQSGDGERPEPQGCAVEMAAGAQGVDGSPTSDPTPQTSMALLQEIEAEAALSEQQAALTAVQNALLSAAATGGEAPAGEGDAQETQNDEKPTEHGHDEEQFTEERAEEADDAVEEQGDEEDHSQSAEQTTEDGENTEVTEQETQDEVAGDTATEEPEATAKDEGDDDNIQDPNEDEVVAAEDNEQQDEDNGEDAAEDPEQKREDTEVAEEDESHKEEEQQVSGEGEEEDAGAEEDVVTGPESITEDEQAASASMDYEEKREDTAAQPADAEDSHQREDTQEDKDTENEGQDPESDSSTQKSAKHVSFRADLTTVCEPDSVESSSNFEDERGLDGLADAEGDTQYTAGDDGADTEW